MKSEDDIAGELAAEIFATDPPTEEMVEITRSSFAFRFAVLGQRRAELFATIRDELGGTGLGRLVSRFFR